MITRMRIQNFRSFEDAEFTLEPVTVFIGPCASGKSNIFSAFALLHGLTQRPLHVSLGDFERQRSAWLNSSESIGFGAGLSGLEGFPGWEARYRLAVTKGGDQYQVIEERLDGIEPEEAGGRRITCFDRKWGADDHPPYGRVSVSDPTLVYSSASAAADDATREQRDLARSVRRALSKVQYYHLEATAMTRMSAIEATGALDPRGENMAACLNWLSSLHSDAVEAIEERLREFLPNFERIVVQETFGEGWYLAFAFRDFAYPLPAHMLSDGTLYSLGYLVISHLARLRSNWPLILCLEEPETGYHPRRLRELMDMFVRLAYPTDGSEPVQVLISTHSPYLLDYFSGEMERCIRVVEMTNGRSTVTEWLERRAQLTPKQLEGAEEVSVGELWAQGLYGGV